MPIKSGPTVETSGSASVIFSRVSEAESCATLAIEHAQECFRIKTDRHAPENLSCVVSQSLGPTRAVQDQRFIHKCPLMRMLRVLPAEVGKKLAGFELKISRQRGGLQIGFFQLDVRSVVLVKLKDDIGKPFEIWIHCSIDRNFSVPQRKAAFDRIMIPELQKIRRIRSRGPTEVH